MKAKTISTDQDTMFYDIEQARATTIIAQVCLGSETWLVEVNVDNLEEFIDLVDGLDGYIEVSYQEVKEEWDTSLPDHSITSYQDFIYDFQ